MAIRVHPRDGRPSAFRVRKISVLPLRSWTSRWTARRMSPPPCCRVQPREAIRRGMHESLAERGRTARPPITTVASRPPEVRSAIRSRSNSANIASRFLCIRAAGDDESNASETDTRATPSSSHSDTTQPGRARCDSRSSLARRRRRSACGHGTAQLVQRRAARAAPTPSSTNTAWIVHLLDAQYLSHTAR